MTIQVNQDLPQRPGSSSHAVDASGNLRSNVTTSVPVSYVNHKAASSYHFFGDYNATGAMEMGKHKNN
jgi:hypothetical protein